MPTTDNSSRIVYSRNNAQIQRIRDLQHRDVRDRTGLYFVDGLQFVASAIRQQIKLETLLLSPKLLIHPLAQRIARQQAIMGTPILSVPPDVYESISLSDEPQGIAAVVHQQWTPLALAHPCSDLCWIALDTLQSPGNLGTILRTCTAVGAAGIILLSETCDPYDPATIRAAMGAHFALRMIRTTPNAVVAWKHQHGCRIIGTSPSAPTDYQAITYDAPVVLLMGCERKGLSPELQSLCDQMVQIPMAGKIDSLNVAIATGVLLYEVFNQHRRKANGLALGASKGRHIRSRKSKTCPSETHCDRLLQRRTI